METQMNRAFALLSIMIVAGAITGVTQTSSDSNVNVAQTFVGTTPAGSSDDAQPSTF
jgi:hypothetical protein